MAYKPQKSIEEHVNQIVTTLLEDDLEHDARHIVDTIMSIVPDHRIGSATNRSVAAAAVWCTSRVCSRCLLVLAGARRHNRSVRRYQGNHSEEDEIVPYTLLAVLQEKLVIPNSKSNTTIWK